MRSIRLESGHLHCAVLMRPQGPSGAGICQPLDARLEGPVRQKQRINKRFRDDETTTSGATTIECTQTKCIEPHFLERRPECQGKGEGKEKRGTGIHQQSEHVDRSTMTVSTLQITLTNRRYCTYHIALRAGEIRRLIWDGQWST
jgi:hypothetical protein